MNHILAILDAPQNSSVLRLAQGALEAEAARRGLKLELRNATVQSWPEAAKGLSALDGVLLAAAEPPTQPAGTTLPVVTTDLVRVARETRKLINQLVPESAVASPSAPVAETKAERKFLVGVTSCPTGIAHTFMAAEGLSRAAAELGFDIKVETRGSVGAKNELSADDIQRADAVIVAADANVPTERFAGKRLLETGTKAAIKDAKALIHEALALQPSAAAGKPQLPSQKPKTGAYKHLMTGVSHMLPLVVAGGLLIALAFAIGGIYAGDQKGTLPAALMQIGGKAAFALFVPVLAGFIAFSIADRPGLTPGLIGGMLASSIGAGFLGGLAAGFLAGYLTLWLNRSIKLPDTLAGLKPVLILPVLSSLVVGLAMIYVIGPPVAFILTALTTWLTNMQSSSALVLGLILGGMMAVDMGGPVNKSAYTFAVGLLASQVYVPMAAVMAAGMVPPLACAIAANVFANRFTADERQASKAAAVLGISFITEGAIPFAAADPLRVIPSLVLGAATTGAISMAAGCSLMVPHGGIFVLAIPHAITHVLAYLVAIVAGTAVSVAALYFAKRPLNSPTVPALAAA